VKNIFFRKQKHLWPKFQFEIFFYSEKSKFRFLVLMWSMSGNFSPNDFNFAVLQHSKILFRRSKEYWDQKIGKGEEQFNCNLFYFCQKSFLEDETTNLWLFYSKLDCNKCELHLTRGARVRFAQSRLRFRARILKTTNDILKILFGHRCPIRKVIKGFITKFLFHNLRMGLKR